MTSSQMSLPDLLSDLITQDNLRKTLELLSLHFQKPKDPDNLDLVDLLKGRLTAIEKKAIAGLDVEKEWNNLRLDILNLVNKVNKAAIIPVQHREIQEIPKNGPQKGKLLHNIPSELAVGKREVCIIRIGETTAQVKFNLKGAPSEIITLPEIGRRMSVVLDSVDDGTFDIQPKSREEQKLPKGVAAEWTFYITPLKAGHHKLLIIVDVLEDMDGEPSAQHSFVHEVDSVTYPSIPPSERFFQEVGTVIAPQPVSTTTKTPASDRRTLSAIFTLGLLIALAFLLPKIWTEIGRNWGIGAPGPDKPPLPKQYFIAKGIPLMSICTLRVDSIHNFSAIQDPKDSTRFMVDFGNDAKKYTDTLQWHDFRLLTPDYRCATQRHQWPPVFDCGVTDMRSAVISTSPDTICHVRIIYDKPMSTNQLRVGKEDIKDFKTLSKDKGVALDLRLNTQNEMTITGHGTNSKKEKCTCETRPFQANQDSVVANATVKCKPSASPPPPPANKTITLTLDDRWLDYFADLEIKFDHKIPKTSPNAKGELFFSNLKPGNHTICIRFEGGKSTGKALLLDCFGEDIQQDIQLVLNENGKIVHKNRISPSKQQK